MIPLEIQNKIDEMDKKISELEKTNKGKTDEIEQLKLEIAKHEFDIKDIVKNLESHYLQ